MSSRTSNHIGDANEKVLAEACGELEGDLAAQSGLQFVQVRAADVRALLDAATPNPAPLPGEVEAAVVECFALWIECHTPVKGTPRKAPHILCEDLYNALWRHFLLIKRHISDLQAQVNGVGMQQYRRLESHVADLQAQLAAKERECEELRRESFLEREAVLELAARAESAETKRDGYKARCEALVKVVKSVQNTFDAIDMTELCPLCQGDEDHVAGCPMRECEDKVNAALAATEVPDADA